MGEIRTGDPFARRGRKALRVVAAEEPDRKLWVDLTRAGVGNVPAMRLSTVGLVGRAIQWVAYSARRRSDWKVTVRLTRAWQPTVNVTSEDFATRDEAVDNASATYARIASGEWRPFDAAE